MGFTTRSFKSFGMLSDCQGFMLPLAGPCGGLLILENQMETSVEVNGSDRFVSKVEDGL